MGSIRLAGGFDVRFGFFPLFLERWGRRTQSFGVSLLGRSVCFLFLLVKSSAIPPSPNA